MVIFHGYVKWSGSNHHNGAGVSIQGSSAHGKTVGIYSPAWFCRHDIELIYVYIYNKFNEYRHSFIYIYIFIINSMNIYIYNRYVCSTCCTYLLYMCISSLNKLDLHDLQETNWFQWPCVVFLAATTELWLQTSSHRSIAMLHWKVSPMTSVKLCENMSNLGITHPFPEKDNFFVQKPWWM